MRMAAVAMVTLTGLGLAEPAGAQQQPAADQAAKKELAQKLSNPVSDLVSVPFQFNWEANVGPSKLTRFVLNVQPVMPFTLGPKWNLVARLIVPMISQPPLTDGGVAASGVPRPTRRRTVLEDPRRDRPSAAARAVERFRPQANAPRASETATATLRHEDHEGHEDHEKDTWLGS